MTETKGRMAQKQRTREAILDGARQLIDAGKPVTVTEAAEVHGISKATAYRYFSDPAVLIAEAGLAIQVQPYEEVVAGASGLRSKLAAIAVYPFDLSIANEAQFRQFLGAILISASHGTLPMKRGARRVAMFERAFAESEHRLTAQEQKALIRSLSVATGIEAMISLFDVVGVDAKTARATVVDVIEAVLDRHLGKG